MGDVSGRREFFGRFFRRTVGRVRKAGVELHLNGTTGTREDVLPLLQHSPDSLSSDDPKLLNETLRSLGR